MVEDEPVVVTPPLVPVPPVPAVALVADVVAATVTMERKRTDIDYIEDIIGFSIPVRLGNHTHGLECHRIANKQEKTVKRLNFDWKSNRET